ncbi:transposase [Streptomyces sp. NPDC058644]
MSMRKPYPSDVTDEQWEFLPHDMPPPGAVKYYFYLLR